MVLSKMFLVLCVMLCMAVGVCAGKTDNDTLAVFEGEVLLEANYGYSSYGDHRELCDFPQIVFCGDVRLGRGWTVSAEFEYERFYENGAWCNSFKDNFTTNRLYVNREFTGKANVKGGIVDVPVGLTNSGGPALAIYDPENEAAIMPLSWHETGVALWGECREWRYEMSFMAGVDVPFNRSCALGLAVRADYCGLADGLRMGASGYWGKSSHGMIGRCPAGDFMGTDGVLLAAFDFDYQKNGLVADGSVVYCTDENVKSAGMELGYDFARLLGWCRKSMSFIPFVRYDGVFAGCATNKFTLGTNVSLLSCFVFKAEYSSRRVCGTARENAFNFGIGYVWAF